VIATGCDRVEQRLMQALNDGAQAVFEYPMKLEGLACGEAQRLAAMVTRKLIKLQPLRRRANTTWQPDTDHELIGRFQLLPATFITNIPIILLIDTVKLHQLHIVIRRDSASDTIKKTFRNGPSQIVALIFHPLVRAQAVERLRE